MEQRCVELFGPLEKQPSVLQTAFCTFYFSLCCLIDVRDLFAMRWLNYYYFSFKWLWSLYLLLCLVPVANLSVMIVLSSYFSFGFRIHLNLIDQKSLLIFFGIFGFFKFLLFDKVKLIFLSFKQSLVVSGISVINTQIFPLASYYYEF